MHSHIQNLALVKDIIKINKTRHILFNYNFIFYKNLISKNLSDFYQVKANKYPRTVILNVRKLYLLVFFNHIRT